MNHTTPPFMDPSVRRGHPRHSFCLKSLPRHSLAGRSLLQRAANCRRQGNCFCYKERIPSQFGYDTGMATMCAYALTSLICFLMLVSPPVYALQIFTELIGDHLIKEEDTKTNTTWERVNPNLPSPDALRYKILIKHKKCIVKERKASTNSQAIAESLTKSAASSSSLASSQSTEIVSDVRSYPCR